MTPFPRFHATGFTDAEVDRFLAGESSAEELVRFQRYCAHAPIDAAWVAVLGRYELVPDANFGADLATGVAQALVAQRLGAFPSSALVDSSPALVVAPHSAPKARWLGLSQKRASGFSGASMLQWAAGVAMLGLVTWATQAIVRRPVATVPPTVYTTTTGQRAQITLRDGSRVILGPQSMLAIAPTFGGGSRDVTLRGEAYFDVNPSTNAPFVVMTSGISTKVLGTTFNLRRYPGDPAVQVFVHTGKVVTTGKTSAAIVTAGRGAYVTDSTVLTTAITELGEYTDLTSEQLVFKRTPVPELLTALGRWYGYEFRLADSSLSNERVSAMIKASDATEMLKVLKAVLDVSMTFDGNVVRLTPNHNGPSVRRLQSNVPARVQIHTPSMEIGR